jgi:adenine-specific DNA-methyltransferase
LSYNNEGLLLSGLIADMMNSLGTYSSSKTEYERFKSKKGIDAGRTVEYLHHLIKH